MLYSCRKGIILNNRSLEVYVSFDEDLREMELNFVDLEKADNETNVEGSDYLYYVLVSCNDFPAKVTSQMLDRFLVSLTPEDLLQHYEDSVRESGEEEL